MAKGGSVIKPFSALIHLIRKPHTIRYPFAEHRDMEGKPLPTERYRGVHINNTATCIGCGLCGRICMNAAITYVEIPELKGVVKGVPKRPVVDYGRCCYCGLCTQICPTGSLKLVPKYEHISTDKKAFKFMPTMEIGVPKGFVVDINKALFPDREDFEERVKKLVEMIKEQKEREEKEKKN